MMIIYFVNDSATLIKPLTLHNTEDHDLLIYVEVVFSFGKQRKL
jgi:hypothetical protein